MCCADDAVAHWKSRYVSRPRCIKRACMAFGVIAARTTRATHTRDMVREFHEIYTFALVIYIFIECKQTKLVHARAICYIYI